MQRSSFATAVLGATLLAALTGALAADKPANVARGKQLYMATGCYQCHGTHGQGGGNAGGRVAPTPIPYEAFLLQLRRPRARSRYSAAPARDRTRTRQLVLHLHPAVCRHHLAGSV
jgi:mono/diheme cytochrome c family protein